MFLIIEAKVSEVFKMIYTTSEDEQLLQKIVVGMADYLHVTRYFDLKTNFTSLIQYLCEACPSLITLTMTHPTTPQAGRRHRQQHPLVEVSASASVPPAERRGVRD